MTKTHFDLARLVTSSKNACFQSLRSIARQSRSQHTQTTTIIHNATKPHRRTSRAAPIVLAVVGVAGGYGLWSTFQNGGVASKNLNTTTFTPFKLVRKDKVSSTCSIFTLEQQYREVQSNDAIEEMWQKGVWSIQIMQPQLQIARAYTPLPPLDPEAPASQMRLLVRKERRGEMSNYIHNTPQDGTLELRGPAVEYALPSNVDRVVFLAGGTGIAPAIQIAHALRDSGNVSIMWANRKREDCEGGKSDTTKSSAEWWFSALGKRLGMSPQSYPPVVEEPSSSSSTGNVIVSQLNQMKKSDNLKIDYFVDEEGTFIKPQDVNNVLSNKVGASAPIQYTSPSSTSHDKIIFVSGPEGFLNYWAGPKIWKDGREAQGPLGGALSHMNLEGWKVVKL